MGKRARQKLIGDPVDVAFFEKLMNSHKPRAFMRA